MDIEKREITKEEAIDLDNMTFEGIRRVMDSFEKEYPNAIDKEYIFEVYHDDFYSKILMSCEVLESDEEFFERMQKEKIRENAEKIRRREHYKILKAEFEGE